MLDQKIKHLDTLLEKLWLTITFTFMAVILALLYPPFAGVGIAYITLDIIYLVKAWNNRWWVNQ